MWKIYGTVGVPADAVGQFLQDIDSAFTSREVLLHTSIATLNPGSARIGQDGPARSQSAPIEGSYVIAPQ